MSYAISGQLLTFIVNTVFYDFKSGDPLWGGTPKERKERKFRCFVAIVSSCTTAELPKL